MEDIEYVDGSGTKVDSYLRALVRVTIQPEEYNGPLYYDPESDGEEYEDINQAGMFFARTWDPDYYDLTSGAYRYALAAENHYDFQMFAKVNFSTIRKDDTRQLIFSWYFYF
jgi:hypothetical protein